MPTADVERTTTIAERTSAYKFNEVSYENIGPLDINNDSHFKSEAAFYEWEGNGTEIAPYIIEGYNVTSNSDCVNIQDVSLYFTIRGCLFNATSQYSGNGIYLYNVTHGRIEDSIFTRKSSAIYAVDAPNLVVQNCTIYDS
jgi:hypothetical protein